MAPPERLRVAVQGAAGYVGGELLRLLAGHPAVGELTACSTSAAGKRWAEVHPSLLHVSEGRFVAPGGEEGGEGVDVTFLALPHGRSQGLMEGLTTSRKRLVIDTSADFRLHDPERYGAAYGTHSSWALTSEFVYGLADVVASRLARQRRIAIPGCFATAALLALFPFLRSGVLGETPTVFAITGSSGAGRELRPTTHHPARAHSFFAYGLSGHRHEAEIGEQLEGWSEGRIASCNLLVHAAPLVRGIYATTLVSCVDPVTDPLALVEEAYVGRPFVKVLDHPPAVAEVVGTNYAHIHAAGRGGGKELIVNVAIDNLVKGAAGQAVQAMNLALGLDERLGLQHVGSYPC